MWARLNKLIKPNGAIVLFGSEPFSSALRMSNIKNYKYDWVWEKNRGSNFAVTKYCPMKEHENISVFGAGKIQYYPIMQSRNGGGLDRVGYKFNASNTGKRDSYGNMADNADNLTRSDSRYPSSIQRFNVNVGLHPTQKPLKLMQYLIKTYTNEGETVLDFTFGSGTTGLAAQNTNRKFIGIEKDDKYFKIACRRISDAKGMF